MRLMGAALRAHMDGLSFMPIVSAQMINCKKLSSGFQGAEFAANFSYSLFKLQFICKPKSEGEQTTGGRRF